MKPDVAINQEVTRKEDSIGAFGLILIQNYIFQMISGNSLHLKPSTHNQSRFNQQTRTMLKTRKSLMTKLSFKCFFIAVFCE